MSNTLMSSFHQNHSMAPAVTSRKNPLEMVGQVLVPLKDVIVFTSPSIILI